MKRYKNAYRALDILANSLRSVFAALSSFVWSLWIIYLFSAEWWGVCVPSLLYIQLGSACMAWGCREYIIRSVSLHPHKEPAFLSNVLFARMPLWLIFVLPAFFLYPETVAAGIVLALSGRFITQSLEGIVVYHRKFYTALAAEAIALSVSLIISMYAPHSSYIYTILYIGMYEMIRGCFFLLICILQVRKVKLSLDPQYLVVAFPFALMGFMGILNSSVDKIFVYTYLGPSEKSFYQVYMNFLLMVTAIPGWILYPFLKNYFRGGDALRSKIRKTLFFSAFLVIPAAVGVIYLLMTRLYHFRLSTELLMMAAVYMIPCFISAPLLYGLIAEGKYYRMAVISVVATVLLGGLCYVLVPHYRLEGAVLSGIAGQFVLLTCSLLLRTGKGEKAFIF